MSILSIAKSSKIEQSSGLPKKVEKSLFNSFEKEKKFSASETFLWQFFESPSRNLAFPSGGLKEGKFLAFFFCL